VKVRSSFGRTVASAKYTRVEAHDTHESVLPPYHQVYAYITMRLTEKLHGDINGLVNLYDRRVDGTNRDYSVRTGGSLAYHLTEHLKLSGELTYSNDAEKTDSLSGSLWLRYHI
jgi:hypothetical protein